MSQDTLSNNMPDELPSSPPTDFENDTSLDGDPDGDRQLTSDSEALDMGLNDSDLGASVAGDIGPKHT